MTTLQLWLTIGVPSILVILSWMQTNSRLSRMEIVTDQRFAQMHTDMVNLGSGLRAEMGQLRAEMGQMRGELRGEMAELREAIAVNAREISSLKDIVYREMVGLHERVTVLESKIS